MAGMSEDRVIALLRGMGSASRDDVVLGIGDDGAVLQPPADRQLVQVVDALFEGVHFLPGIQGADLAWRGFGVNLSDIAAMGAEPAWATLVLSMPAAEPRWLEDFARGVAQCTRAHDLALVGGDTVRGPLGVSVQVTGFVPPGQALLRSGARPGDGIYLTGQTGLAAAGLAVLKGELAPGPDSADWRQRFLRPQPRLSQGRDLRGVASACLDVSDGLARDLGRVLAASGVGGELAVESLPGLAALAGQLGEERALDLVLCGGDDYELCFTVPPQLESRLQQRSAGWDCACTRIGRVTGGQGLKLTRAGRDLPLPSAGFEHF